MSILSKKIKSLNDGERFIFTYKGKDYDFKCYSVSKNYGPDILYGNIYFLRGN